MIGTLSSSSSSSSTKIILEDFRIFHSGTEILSSVPRKNTFHHYYNNKLLRLDSTHKNRILKPIPLGSSSIEVSQVNIEEAVAASTKTVRVRFQLRKECVFGEQFFIIGDDPVFNGGLWDPENALLMNWSDGHVWTIDLDLPVGRLVEFKFILKAMTGEILWQPGRNRGIETWETERTIRVCEDWENADLQMMIEEDFVPINQEEEHYRPIPMFNTDVSSNGGEKEEEVFTTVQQNSSSDNETEKTMEPLTALTGPEANVSKEAMFSEEEEVPVLVPGLIPMSDLENEEESDDELIEVINEEGKAESFLEVDKEEEGTEKTKIKAVSVFDKSEIEAVNGVTVEERHYSSTEEEIQEKQLETEPLETPNVVLENDIEWGRKTFYKLLSNFGLF